MPQVPEFELEIPDWLYPTTVEEARKSSHSSSRIIDGKSAKEGQFPHQIRSKAKKGAHKYSICGGSVISKKTVLTAAHCTIDHDSFEVGFGVIDLQNPDVEMTVTKFIVHEKFNPKNLNNDIALFILPSELTYTDNIKPIQLPSKSQKATTFDGSKATVSGFGKTGDDESSSSKLLYVHQKIISNKECVKTFGRRLVKGFTLCAEGYDNMNQSTCKGDSGGPLITHDDNLGKDIQVGVVSFVAKKGCEAKLPTGFVRVTYFLDWIEKNSDVKIRS